LIIDVMEGPPVAEAWAKRWKFTFPVLLDADGTATERYAPAGVLPDLPRNQVPIASNLIIDGEGKIHGSSWGRPSTRRGSPIDCAAPRKTCRCTRARWPSGFP